MLGGGVGPGLAAPDAGAEPATAVVPRLPWGERARNHPYARLIRDARFSAFWVAQTVSLFGDRLNQIAIGALVLAVTKSPQDAALVYLAAMLPNLLLGPLAGTFVDRWDQKRTMIASDLIRAALVVAIPFVAQRNVVLVYAAAFLVTSVSLFFRPAKAAVVPRIVSDEDLTAANAALWTGETFADIAGFPLAAVLLYLMNGDYALAFWMDAATYVVSAVLIGGLIIPPVVRLAGPRVSSAVRAFFQELREGWSILRDKPPLFQNTLISVVAQLAIGATMALMVAYTAKVVNGEPVPDTIRQRRHRCRHRGGQPGGRSGHRGHRRPHAQGPAGRAGLRVHGSRHNRAGPISYAPGAADRRDDHRHLQSRLRHPHPDTFR